MIANRRKNTIKAAAFILAALVFLGFLQRLLVPKYADGIVEGAFIAEYYKEEDKNFDVVFIGDCEVYENFSPVALWNEYGINSYIRGSAEQYIMQSYYLLEDTLRYETPKAVVFNIQSLQFGEAKSEAYNRMSLEGMRWSVSKVNAIRASMTEDEHFIEYVFPILRYHTRWSELKSTDFKYMFNTPPVSFNGYFMRVDVRPAENVPEGKLLKDYSFAENAWKYLYMMKDLCDKNGIELIMIKAPSLYPYWYPQWDEQVAEYAEENGLTYINFLDHIDEIGLDYSKDTYDAGLHLNLSGAEKLSHYFGEILQNDHNIPDRRGDAALSAIWQKETAAYNAEREAQYIKYNISK